MRKGLCRGCAVALFVLLAIGGLPRGALGEIWGEGMNPKNTPDIPLIDVADVFSKEDFLRLRDWAFQQEAVTCYGPLNNVEQRYVTGAFSVGATYAGGAPVESDKADFVTLHLTQHSPLADQSDCFAFEYDFVLLPENDAQTRSRAKFPIFPGMQEGQVYFLFHPANGNAEQMTTEVAKQLHTLKATHAAQPASSEALFRLGETSYYSDGQAIYVVLSNELNSSGFVAPADHLFGNRISLTDAPFTPPGEGASLLQRSESPLNKNRVFHRLSVAEFHQFIEPGRQYFSANINVAVQCPDLNFWQEDVYARLETCGENLFPQNSHLASSPTH